MVTARTYGRASGETMATYVLPMFNLCFTYCGVREINTLWISLGFFIICVHICVQFVQARVEQKVPSDILGGFCKLVQSEFELIQIRVQFCRKLPFRYPWGFI